MIELPTENIAPTITDPRVLALYSFPKVGKTPCIAKLPKCLILDLEHGTDLISATKVTIIGLTHKRINETPEQLEARHKIKEYYLSEIIAALREKNPYKYIAVDTITVLADWCEEDATYMYMASVIGKNFNKYDEDDFQKSGGRLIPGTYKPKNEWASVLTLPKGAGHPWLWKSFTKWLDYLRALKVTIILAGHVKLSTITKKLGQEVEGKDLELSGKLKTIVTAQMADAIGYMYREGNKNFISFEPSDEIRCGCRVPHLEGKNLLISEKLDDGTIKVYWENIFKDLQTSV